MNVKDYLESLNISPEKLEDIIKDLEEKGYDDSFEIPYSDGLTLGDFKKYYNETLGQTKVEDRQANEEIVKEYEKMNHQDLFSAYATILSQMAGILDVAVYPGIENENPYDIHYDLNDEEKQLFITLQERATALLSVEPTLQSDYEEVMGRVAEIRNEMGELVDEKPVPGIEYIDTASLDARDHARFVELRNQLSEIKRDYPGLFANEQVRTFGNKEVEKENEQRRQEQMNSLEEHLAIKNDDALASAIKRQVESNEDRDKAREEEYADDHQEIFNQGEAEKSSNRFAGLSEGDLYERLATLQEYSEGEDMENDPNNMEIEDIMAELDRRKEEKEQQEQQQEQQVEQAAPEVVEEVVENTIEQQPQEELYELKHDEIIQDDLSTDDIEQNFGPGMTDEEIEAARRNIDTPPTPVQAEPIQAEPVQGVVVDSNNEPIVETVEETQEDFQAPQVYNQAEDFQAPQVYNQAEDFQAPQVVDEVEHVQGEVVEANSNQQTGRIPDEAFANLSQEQLAAMIMAAEQAKRELNRRQQQQQAFMNPNNNANSQGTQVVPVTETISRIPDPQQQTQPPHRQIPQQQTQSPQRQIPQQQTASANTNANNANKPRKAKAPLRERARKAAKHTMAFTGGLATGFAASQIGGVLHATGIIPAVKVAKLVGKGVNAWSKKHPDGKIAGVVNKVTDKKNEMSENFRKKHPNISEKVDKVKKALKNPYLKTFINGVSYGYIAGSIYNAFKPKTPELYSQGNVGLHGDQAVGLNGQSLPEKAQEALTTLYENGQDYSFVGEKVDEVGNTLWGIAKDGHLMGYFREEEIVEMAAKAAGMSR